MFSSQRKYREIKNLKLSIIISVSIIILVENQSDATTTTETGISRHNGYPIKGGNVFFIGVKNEFNLLFSTALFLRRILIG